MTRKLQIMKTRPQITDEEINRYMNFEAVLSEHAAHKKNANRWLLKSLGFGGLGAAALVVYMISASEPTTTTAQASPAPTTVSTDSASVSTTPVTALPAQPQSIAEQKSAQRKEERKPDERKPEVKTDKAPEAPVTEKREAQYTQAEPVKGFPDLYDYFNRELQYPKEAMKDSIQGIVSVTFVINTEGKAEQVKVQNSLGELFDREAQRLIANMPEWKPASLNGKPVPAKLSMPITFRISTAKPE
jgi:TonB family protein